MNSRHYITLAILLYTLLGSACRKHKPDDTTPGSGDTTVNNTASWKLYGNPVETANTNAQATITIDGNGVAYLLFADGKHDNKATVMKLNNNTWSVLGTAGFSEGRVSNPVMVIDAAGTLYVTYVETGTSGINKVSVMHFDGSAWSPVGNTRFQANTTSAAAITLNNNLPVVSYVAPPYTGIAMQYDGTNWNNIFTSDAARRVYDIDFADGTNYLAYLWDTSIGTTHLDVMKQSAGWVNLNFPASVSPNSYTITTDPAGRLFISVEGKSPGRQASVFKYINTWENLGTVAFSTGIAANPYIVISTDSVYTPYLTYRNSDSEPVVMSFTDNWNNVGTGFPTNTVSHSSLAFNNIDKLVYVALSNTDGTITVMRYE